MLDLGAGELLLIAIVAVIVIGPKDIPLAMRTAGRWIGQIRRVSSHFRSGIDTMIREAEMEEMEKKWAAQNAKIMKEHPAEAPPEMEPTGALPARPAAPAQEATPLPAQEPTPTPTLAQEPSPAPEPLPSPEASAEARAVPPATSAPAPAPADEPQLPFGNRK